jgi:hypothetical protein
MRDRVFGEAGPMTASPPDPSRTQQGAARRALRWAFRSRRTGRLTVVQWPNVPLWVFIVASVAVRVVHPSGRIHQVARVVAVVALLLWALDEMVRGVNPFRRLLGAAVALATAVNLLVG